MNSRLSALFLTLTVAGTASAQDTGITIHPNLGAFAPMLPIVSVADGANPDIELAAAPSAGIDVGMGLGSWGGVYGGVTAAFTRLHHSGALELDDLDAAASSRVDMLLPAAGVLLTPDLGGVVQPTLRLGVGAKLYNFDLVEVDRWVANLAGDVGVGVTAGSGPVYFTAEARWAPSQFNAGDLPIRVDSDDGQFQSDWFFRMGFSVQP